MSYETQGLKVTFIGKEDKKSDRYSIRVLRGTITKNYGEQSKEQVMEFTFANNNMEKLNRIKVGDSVTVKWDVDSREHEGRVYTNLRGWYVGVEGNNTGVPADPFVGQNEVKDDLPF
jgi:ribosomal protein L3